ncbi:MAG: hypothetical protein ACE5G9_10045 [Nitrospinales bacterium]
MKVKNQGGMVLHVPDDWSAEVLREKSLTALANYEDMSLQELKALARRRKIRIGRSGKKRLAQLLMESDA